MRFGVSAYNVDARELMEIAVAAEAAGFDHLWLGEHLIHPVQYRSAHPSHAAPEDPTDTRYSRAVEEKTELLDPLVALAAVAARTSRIRLATGIYLLPLRHPLLTARAAATLSEVSGGRFMLGVGAGWLEEEFEAFAVPFAERARRHEESIEVLRSAFRGGPFAHQGDHFRFADLQISKRPVPVPIVMGGNSAPALRRAARLGDAWFSSGSPTLEEAVGMCTRLEELRLEAGRPQPLECYVRSDRFGADLGARYAEAGLADLVFWAQDIRALGVDHHSAFRRAADELGIDRR